MSSSDAANPATAIDGGRSDNIIACVAVLTFVATIAVGLRFYVRAKLLRSIKSEDWCILVALIFCIVFAGLAIQERHAGMGRHMATLSAADIMAYLKTTYFKTLCYNFSLFFTKISILLLYLRVLTHDYIRKVTWVTMGIVAIYNAWGLAMYLSMCIPLAKMWDPSIQGGCHPISVWWALTYLHIITDFIIFVIPIPVVATMRISGRQKAGLLIVFTVGLFVCLISVVRTVQLNELIYRADMTWDLVPIANWSTVEMNAAVVCGCMPTLKPVMVKVFGPVTDRIFPQQHPPQGDPAGGRPRTIGSMPMRVFNFGRQSKDQVSTMPAQSQNFSKDGGAPSLTDVETNQSEPYRKDLDLEKGLNVDDKDFAVEPSTVLGVPPTAHVKG